MLIVHNVHRKK